jgi:hypothetical protein
MELVSEMNRGVHFSGPAYANLAHVLKESFRGLAENTLNQSDPAATVAGLGLHARGQPGKSPNYYFRGFNSPVGINAAVLPSKTGKHGRDRSHPYMRKR